MSEFAACLGNVRALLLMPAVGAAFPPRAPLRAGEAGRNAAPQVVSADDPAFGFAAVQAAAAWRFAPPRAGGKPALVRLRAPFNFARNTKAKEATPGAPAAPTSSL